MGHDPGELDFRALYEQHASLVRSVLYRFCGSADLDDLVQETFVKVWKGRAEFKGESAVSTWIVRIAINVAKNHQRAKRRRWWQILSDDPKALDLVSGRASAEKELSARRELDQALQTLSPKLREVVILYSLRELDIETIAGILEISEGTVKSRLHLARKKLNELFGPYEE